MKQDRELRRSGPVYFKGTLIFLFVVAIFSGAPEEEIRLADNTATHRSQGMRKIDSFFSQKWDFIGNAGARLERLDSRLLALKEGPLGGEVLQDFSDLNRAITELEKVSAAAGSHLLALKGAHVGDWEVLRPEFDRSLKNYEVTLATALQEFKY